MEISVSRTAMEQIFEREAVTWSYILVGYKAVGEFCGKAGGILPG